MPILWCQLLDVCSNCSTENWSVPLMRASSHLQVWKPRLKYFCWIPARLHRSTVAFLPRASPCFPISFIQAILNNYFPEFKLTKTFFFFFERFAVYICGHAHTTGWTSGDQRATCRSWSSPSTMWILGTELRFGRHGSRRLYLLYLLLNGLWGL